MQNDQKKMHFVKSMDLEISKNVFSAFAFMIGP